MNDVAQQMRPTPAARAGGGPVIGLVIGRFIWGAPALRLALALGFGLLAVGMLRAQRPVDTDPLNNTPAVRDAFQRFYNLDYDGALARFQQIAAQHSSDPIATTYVLDCVLFRELYRLDLLDTTFYANDGFLTGRQTVVQDPQVRDRVNELADRAIGQANDILKSNPNDVNALFARGWARSLKATYLAMVDRSFGGGLHLALQARSDHDKVLELDPNYVDAKMVVGVYQFVVGSLPFAFKLLIGFTGITGSKSKGMEMLRDSAARGVITSVESRTAMALFLRREAQYPEAINITRNLSVQYPHDFLFFLEEGNLLKDAGKGPEAIAAYRRLIDEAKRPGFFSNPHLELAWYGLGDTLRGQNMNADAVTAYEQGAAQPTISPELKRRCLLNAGEVLDRMNQHDRAIPQYQAVIALGPETVQGEAARKYIRSGYDGR
ncbi:MAG TPA: tetratricopeptide repeat protein [Acidisarcina sp.]